MFAFIDHEKIMALLDKPTPTENALAEGVFGLATAVYLLNGGK